MGTFFIWTSAQFIILTRSYISDKIACPKTYSVPCTVVEEEEEIFWDSTSSHIYAIWLIFFPYAYKRKYKKNFMRYLWLLRKLKYVFSQPSNWSLDTAWQFCDFFVYEWRKKYWVISHILNDVESYNIFFRPLHLFSTTVPCTNADKIRFMCKWYIFRMKLK